MADLAERCFSHKILFLLRFYGFWRLSAIMAGFDLENWRFSVSAKASMLSLKALFEAIVRRFQHVFERRLKPMCKIFNMNGADEFTLKPSVNFVSAFSRPKSV